MIDQPIEKTAISFYLAASLIDQMRVFAKATRRTQSGVLELALAEYLARNLAPDNGNLVDARASVIDPRD